MKWVKTGERVVFYGMTSKKIKQKLEREPWGGWSCQLPDPWPEEERPSFKGWYQVDFVRVTNNKVWSLGI
jgi:hypothetical protein